MFVTHSCCLFSHSSAILLAIKLSSFATPSLPQNLFSVETICAILKCSHVENVCPSEPQLMQNL